jgi:hypothetical protein
VEVVFFATIGSGAFLFWWASSSIFFTHPLLRAFGFNLLTATSSADLIFIFLAFIALRAAAYSFSTLKSFKYKFTAYCKCAATYA